LDVSTLSLADELLRFSETVSASSVISSIITPVKQVEISCQLRTLKWNIQLVGVRES
jgi:hypothetical protein